jgi:proline iminopeptidase
LGKLVVLGEYLSSTDDPQSKWETATSKLIVDPEYIKKSTNPEWALAFARIECHYFLNGGFMADGELLASENIAKIKHLPISIVQGRYDVVCPAITSWNLYRALGGEKNDNLTYKILGDCGHSAHEVGIEEQLLQFADAFKILKRD